MKRIIGVLFAVILISSLLLAACAQPAPAPAPAPDPTPAKERTITLGFLSGFTGPLAIPTKMQFNMSKAYYDWASDTGLMPGIRFNMVTEDTRYDMAQIVPAYMRMQPKNPMIIQFIYSQDGDTIKPLAARDMIPAVGYVTSTLGVLPPEFVFSVSPLWDNYEIMVLNWIQDTWDMEKMGRPARYAHLGWDNTMGASGIKPGELYAEKLSKVEHVGAEIAPPGTMDFSTYVIRLKKLDPDYIWCPLVSG
ncbi:MAG: ABC transporter substrate-binding protein, partial [Chloroflexi bacterium]|nr:ABC transporter substrate-binding protein [Chloroflexota bacterium]